LPDTPSCVIKVSKPLHKLLSLDINTDWSYLSHIPTQHNNPNYKFCDVALIYIKVSKYYLHYWGRKNIQRLEIC
jgi:hypothetical protein